MYGYGMGSFSNYFIYLIIIMAVPLYAQFKVRSTYSKFSKVGTASGFTGAQAARIILDQNGLSDVAVQETHGVLSDHYDPRTKVVRLSSENYHGHSVAGVAVAAHEVGHAIQDATAYTPLRIRHALVPVVNFASSLSWVFILLGFLSTAFNNLLLIGIILIAAGVVFQFVTLPVEFNASSRAVGLLRSSGIITPEEVPQSKKVLNAAALTYVAAALVAVLELLRLLAIFNSRED